MTAKLNDCPVEQVMAMLSGRWKIPLYRHMYKEAEPVRYSALLRHMPSVSRKMLTEQLREMEADGIVERTVHEAVPPKAKVAYSLTPRGRAMIGFLDMMSDWSREHMR